MPVTCSYIHPSRKPRRSSKRMLQCIHPTSSPPLPRPHLLPQTLLAHLVDGSLEWQGCFVAADSPSSWRLRMQKPLEMYRTACRYLRAKVVVQVFVRACICLYLFVYRDRLIVTDGFSYADIQTYIIYVHPYIHHTPTDTYKHIHTRTYTCTYIHIHTHTHTCTYTHAHSTYLPTYLYLPTCNYNYPPTYIDTHAHAYTYIDLHADTYIHTHTRTST